MGEEEENGPKLGPDGPGRLKEDFSLSNNIPRHLLIKIIRKMPIQSFTLMCRSSSFIYHLMQDNWNSFNCYIDYEFCVAPKDKKSDMIPKNYDTTFYIFSTTFYELFDGFFFSDIDEIIDTVAFVRFGTIKIGNELVGKGFLSAKTAKILSCFQRNRMTCDQLILQSFVEATKALTVTRAKKLTIHHRKSAPLEIIPRGLLSTLDECHIVIHSWICSSSQDNNYTIFHDILPHLRLVLISLFVDFSIPYLLNFLQKIVSHQAETTDFYLDYWKEPPAILQAVKEQITEHFPLATIAEASNLPPAFVALIPLSNEKRQWLFFALEDWSRWALIRGFIVDSWEEANEKELKKIKKLHKARQGRETNIEAYLNDEDIDRMKQAFEKR